MLVDNLAILNLRNVYFTFSFKTPNWDRKLQFSGISTQTFNLGLGNLKLTKAAAFDINYFL